METSISRFYGAMSAFLSHIQTSSDALADSLRRRPIPLDSATASFTQRLGQRVAAAASDLELLEDMAMGTVSFAELFGHMSEVYKRNQDYVDLLQDHLSSLGYVPESDQDGMDDNQDFNVDPKCLSPESGLQQPPLASGSTFEVRPSRNILDEDPLIFGDSESLQDIGLSDSCLATLACEANDNLSSLCGHSENPSGLDNGGRDDEKASHHSSQESNGSKDAYAIRSLIEISRNDYDKLPSYVKGLASWEDLQEAVTKINQGISMDDASKSRDSFKEADFEEFGLGRKGKSYVLALIKMNKLVVDTEGSSVIYRIAKGGIN